MLLHETDRLLIGPLTPDIMATFHITMTQMGAVSTGALIVGAVLYPVWGYAYDRFSRPKLLSLASFIWGSTTWISAAAPSYPVFLATRASTGIDDSSYPGLFSLVSDYFGPKVRGRVYGLLRLTQPLGYIIGMVLGLILTATLGWRAVFYLTGGLGLVVAGLIFFSLRETPADRLNQRWPGSQRRAPTTLSGRRHWDFFERAAWCCYLFKASLGSSRGTRSLSGSSSICRMSAATRIRPYW
jgi:MFS family permease